MPENQTVWNSDNPGVKETFIQTSRMGGDGRWAAEQKGMCGKVADCIGKVGLAEWETKDSKPPVVKYCGGCDSGRNPQSHRRVPWKVGLDWASKWHCSLSDPSPTDSATTQQRVLPFLVNT